MRKLMELLDPDNGPIVWFVGPALIILSICLGIGVVNMLSGPSWGEICVSKGGEFVVEQVQFPDNPEKWADNQRCELP